MVHFSSSISKSLDLDVANVIDKRSIRNDMNILTVCGFSFALPGFLTSQLLGAGVVGGSFVV